MEQELMQKVQAGKDILRKLYGDKSSVAEKRYERLINKYYQNFSGNAAIYSASGRVEIIGNHTDHNNGCVLATSIGSDTVAAAAPNGTDIIRIISEGFDKTFEVNITERLPIEDEKNTTNALIRGVVGYFYNNGLEIGGFDAYVTSEVPGGSGLSSSASFEVLIGCILSNMFNSGSVTPVTLAIAGQYAENIYFGKPCGLMDQMASAYGGIVGIDFKVPTQPKAETIDIDFSKSGYVPVVVHLGDSHADLTHEYAAITNEMLEVANYFGEKKLRNVDEKAFYKDLPALYSNVKDRAILRAIHFFDENRRVQNAIEFLKKNNIEGFLTCVNESGESSWKYLQNCYAGSEQAMTVALALAEKLLKGHGASRVHGGGFGGTVLAFVPSDAVEGFVEGMDAVYGKGTSSVLYIRPVGACRVF